MAKRPSLPDVTDVLAEGWDIQSAKTLRKFEDARNSRTLLVETDERKIILQEFITHPAPENIQREIHRFLRHLRARGFIGPQFIERKDGYILFAKN